MKQLLLFFTVVMMAAFMPIAVKADCSNKEKNELSALASNVKIDYEAKKREVSLDGTDNGGNIISTTYDQRYFEVSIYNVTPELVINVVGGTADVIYTYADSKDGIVTFATENANEVAKYSFTIKSNSTNCSDVQLRAMSLTLPKYNIGSTYQICDDAKDYYLCKEYITIEGEMTDADFFEKVENYLAKNGKIDDNNGEEADDANILVKSLSFIGKYWYYFVSGLILVGIVVTVIVVTRIRRRSI